MSEAVYKEIFPVLESMKYKTNILPGGMYQVINTSDELIRIEPVFPQAKFSEHVVEYDFPVINFIKETELTGFSEIKKLYGIHEFINDLCEFTKITSFSLIEYPNKKAFLKMRASYVGDYNLDDFINFILLFEDETNIDDPRMNTLLNGYEYDDYAEDAAEKLTKIMSGKL